MAESARVEADAHVGVAAAEKEHACGLLEGYKRCVRNGAFEEVGDWVGVGAAAKKEHKCSLLVGGKQCGGGGGEGGGGAAACMDRNRGTCGGSR